MHSSLTKELYFTTSTVVDWVDVFTRPEYKHIILESLAYCQKNKDLDLYAWVLMTNHLHMIVGTRNEEANISDILRDFKKYTSKKIVDVINDNVRESRKVWMMDRFWFVGNNDRKIKNFKFWQDGSYIETLYSYGFYLQKLDYIIILL